MHSILSVQSKTYSDFVLGIEILLYSKPLKKHSSGADLWISSLIFKNYYLIPFVMSPLLTLEGLFSKILSLFWQLNSDLEAFILFFWLIYSIWLTHFKSQANLICIQHLWYISQGVHLCVWKQLTTGKNRDVKLEIILKGTQKSFLAYLYVWRSRYFYIK